MSDALGQRYEIMSDLGEGSFGTVYRASDTFLNRIVAVKSVRLDVSPDPSTREDLKKRFFREAQVAAQLRHPNIVTIHDIIQTKQAGLIIMEFVEGLTLQCVLASYRRLGLSETVNIVSQVALALDYAHGREVVHRDVKPANILVTAANEVRVTDFGIAKIDSSSDLTIAGTILGTPDYMSPEQAKGEEVSGRSDLFSLGCILYECLVGEKPFQSESVAGVLLRIVGNDPPPSVDWRRLGLPSGLDGVMKRALAKNPSLRFPSGAALVQSLKSLSAEEGHAGPSSPMERADLGTPPPLSAKGASVQKPSNVRDGAECRKSDAGHETACSEPSHLTTLREEDRYLCLSSSIQEVLAGLDLSPGEAFILSRIDGRSRPVDILAVSPFPETETVRTLLGLIEIGLLTFRKVDEAKAEPEQSHEERAAPERDPADEAAVREINESYERSRFQDHAQILGVDRDAGLEEIQKAFKDKSVRYNPAAYPHLDDPDFREKLRRLLKLAYEAFVALSKRAGEKNRSRPEPCRRQEEQKNDGAGTRVVVGSSTHRDRRSHAAEIFKRAERAFLTQDYWETIQLCRHAIEICGEQAKYHHLLGLALLANTNWRKDAEESLIRATELDPDNPEYYQVLGRLYEQDGLSARASRMFDKAKSLSESP